MAVSDFVELLGVPGWYQSLSRLLLKEFYGHSVYVQSFTIAARCEIRIQVGIKVYQLPDARWQEEHCAGSFLLGIGHDC